MRFHTHTNNAKLLTMNVDQHYYHIMILIEFVLSFAKKEYFSFHEKPKYDAFEEFGLLGTELRVFVGITKHL